MNTSRKKIYFASDAHLGARFHKDPLAVEKKLVRWLDSIKDEAMAIYFLGDMFDYWYEYKYVVGENKVKDFKNDTLKFLVMWYTKKRVPQIPGNVPHVYHIPFQRIRQ